MRVSNYWPELSQQVQDHREIASNFEAHTNLHLCGLALKDVEEAQRRDLPRCGQKNLNADQSRQRNAGFTESSIWSGFLPVVASPDWPSKGNFLERFADFISRHRRQLSRCGQGRCRG
jgi:hypothetical protein